MKTPISLSSIIESFTKVAEEDVLSPEEAQEVPEDEIPGQEGIPPAQEDTEEALVGAAKTVVEADAAQEEALALLKELALEAASVDDAQIAKEAMLHGKVMAHSLLQEMDKVAAQRTAYQVTEEMLASKAQEDFEALSGITKAAFDLTNDYLAKCAAEDTDEVGEGSTEEDADEGIDTETEDDDVEEIEKDAAELMALCKQAYEEAFFGTGDYLAKCAAEDTDEVGEGSTEEDADEGIDTETEDDDVEEIAKEAFDQAFSLTNEYLENLG
ncbi:MAG: hypothetical protein LHW56_01540 [Candidatus Cloacimonetes bacterium]|nr:hypothetical protein [Candidatus Cloacimonadota bacterium]MDY0171570.1 hypothetical protein [Candidatus Cloacimonadaceae bacterium]